MGMFSGPSFAAFVGCERCENCRVLWTNLHRCYPLLVYLRYSVGTVSHLTKELTDSRVSPIKRISILSSDLLSDSFYCADDGSELRFWEVSLQMMTFSKIL